MCRSVGRGRALRRCGRARAAARAPRRGRRACRRAPSRPAATGAPAARPSSGYAGGHGHVARAQQARAAAGLDVGDAAVPGPGQLDDPVRRRSAAARSPPTPAWAPRDRASARGPPPVTDLHGIVALPGEFALRAIGGGDDRRDHDAHRPAAADPRPRRPRRGLRRLGVRGAGPVALPGAGGGAAGARHRRQRHPLDADRLREVAGGGRARTPRPSPRGQRTLLHRADQGAGQREVLRADRRVRRREGRHAHRRRRGERDARRSSAAPRRSSPTSRCARAATPTSARSSWTSSTSTPTPTAAGPGRCR